MPYREHNLIPAASLETVAPPDPLPAPTWGEALEAGFGLENDIRAAMEIVSRPVWKDTPNYDIVGKLKTTPWWDSPNREDFLDVRSDEEFNYISGLISQKNKQRDTLLRAGWAGYGVAVLANAVSPTMFIPLVAGGRGLQAVARSVALGAAAGVAQEAPLGMADPSRTYGEMITGIAASSLVGGIFGGAVAVMTKAEREAIEAGMVDRPGRQAISRPVAGGAEATASADPGKLAPGAGVMLKITDSNPVSGSPITQNLQSDSVEGRISTAKLSDAGLTSENNIKGVPTAKDGTVENNITPWWGRFFDTLSDNRAAYNDYVYDGAPPVVLPTMRADWQARFSQGQKLRFHEFNEAVTRAAWGEPAVNKFVEKAAKAFREKIFDHTWEQMKAVKGYDQLKTESADTSYVTRIPNHEAINRNPVGFMNFLAKHYNVKMQADFTTAWEKFALKQARDEEFLTDAARSAEEIQNLRDELGAQLKGVEARREAEQFTALQDTIDALRVAARPLKGGTVLDEADRKQLLADARDMEKQAGPRFAETKLERREIKHRLSGLNKATAVLEERLANKLSKIERAEELSEAGLMRIARKGKKILDEMENWTDEKLDAEWSRLTNDFERVAGIYDRGEERIAKLVETDEVLRIEAAQEARADRMTEVAESIADAEDLGRDAMRDLIMNMLDESISRVNKINSKRAVRVDRLRKQAAELQPAAVAERLAARRTGMTTREVEFRDKWRELGADDLPGPKGDIATGKADFSDTAMEAAKRTLDKFRGTMLRLPVVDMLADKRSSMLPRLLSFIPSSEMAPWLEMDIEKIARHYIRTMSSDIEIAKKFDGEVNAEGAFTRVSNEEKTRLIAVANSNMTPKKKEKESLRIKAETEMVLQNLETTVKRLRHMHGLPQNPDGWGYRLAQVASDLNVLRLMGGVTISSFPDLGKPIMRYGITRTFRDGYLPFINNLKAMKMLRREGQLAGVIVEAIAGLRASSVIDAFDDVGRGSKFERGMKYASGKQGIVATFSFWTDLQKAFTFGVANAMIFDSIATVMTTPTKTVSKVRKMKDVDPRTMEIVEREIIEAVGVPTKNIDKEIQFLASLGFDDARIRDIWNEVQTNGGGGKVKGVWLPNTELWKNQQAVQAYRQAVAREVNNTIVTPGVERPAWMTATTMGRLVGQFKSFGFSSTHKTLAAGLQQRDAAVVQGVMSSLALGALSYYLWGVAGGGERYEKMMNSSFGTWADEAISRSGIGGAFTYGQEVLNRVPLVAPYTSFGGQGTTRRGGQNIVDEVGGPTYDLIQRALQVITGIDDPTEATVHAARLLTPYQNVSILSRAFDAIEAAANETFDIPERRQ